MNPYILLSSLSKLIAFAGGGGSGGGGGTGGGDSSGGGGVAFIFLIGYAPMHLIGAFVRKLKKKEAEWIAGQIIGWLICIVALIGLIILSATITGLFFIAAIGAPFGMAAGLYNLFGRLKQSKSTKLALQKAEQSDSAWNEAGLTGYSKKIFMQYQQDWSNFNIDNMKSYMTDNYHNHAKLMMAALKIANRRDNVMSPVIDNALVTSLNDEVDNSNDTVIIGFTAHADDQLMDTSTNKVLFRNKSSITEFWRFKRTGNNWLLDGIQPSTANMWSHNQTLETFASQQGFYYSLDWGYLLLPSRGQIFGKGQFGVSDINNHIIGLYKNIVVQLYTYNENPNAQYGSDKFLVVQTSLPKSYGNIVVRQNKKLQLGIRGLQKVSMEWGQFNSRYEVYATSSEQATSFELLNPLYMQKLQALNFEVNMEVVDNILYLYTAIKYDATTSNLTEYQTMLDLLKDAFEQMKM